MAGEPGSRRTASRLAKSGATRSAAGLEECGIFVVLLTPAAVRSRWVTTETTLAIELEHKDILRFIPVKVASCRPPLLWTAYQCVPFTPRYDTGLAALLAALATRQSPIAAQPPPVVAPSARPARPQRAKKARPQPVARKAEVEPTAAALAPSPDAFVITAPIRLELVRIPAGEFLMGSDPARDPQAFLNEQPQHLVHLPEFSIGKCPVTNDQYALFAKETNHRMPDHWPDGQVPAGCGAHPVVFVSWHRRGRLLRLAESSHRPTHPPAHRSRMGESRPRPRRPALSLGESGAGHNLVQLRQQRGRHNPLGHYPAGASPCGALDMAGNVWEWCNSLRKDYPYRVDDGREDPDSTRFRILPRRLLVRCLGPRAMRLPFLEPPCRQGGCHRISCRQ